MGDLNLIYAGSSPEDFSKEEIGMKGKNLLQLFLWQKNSRAEVPDFFIVPTSFYRDYAQRHSIDDVLHINSLADINEYLKQDYWVYSGTQTPQPILDQFYAYGEEYKIIQDAAPILSGVKEHSLAWRNLRRRFPEFVKQTEKGMNMDEYQEIVSRFRNRQGFSAVFDRIKTAYDNKAQLIYRSSSPLEDDDAPFAGVFDSSESQSEILQSRTLAWVLASPYSPFAQFYFEKNHITPNREMAVIIQRHIFPQFYGEILTGNPTRIRYFDRFQGTREGFRVDLENGKITRYLGRNKTHKVWGSGDEMDERRPNDKLPPKTIHVLDEIAQDISMKAGFPCQIEFVTDVKGRSYLVQFRKRYSEEKHHDIPEIAPDSIIASAIGFTVGECSGPAINLLPYDTSKRERVKYSDLDGLTIDALKELDYKYPGAIYIVDPFQFFSRLKDGVEQDKLFYMLTPNKKGIIICNHDSTWEHMNTIYEHEKIFLCHLKDTRKHSIVRKLADGDHINVVSNGYKAVIYR